MKRRVLAGAALTALVIAGAALVPLAAGSAAATYSLQAKVPWQGVPARCGGSYPTSVTCYGHPGGRVAVPGLGVVSQSYAYPVETNPGPACSGGFQVLPYSARLVVSGKGALSLAVDAAEGCLQGPPSDTVLGPTQTFRVTGGSGLYAGASGSGVLSRTRIGRQSSGHGFGTDVWRGTLVVPGLVFDLRPPRITGAVARVVRAARGVTRVRVRYTLRATDSVDGAIPVACRPGSGSFFTVGRRTVVRCSATDRSANTARATFTVTVTQP